MFKTLIINNERDKEDLGWSEIIKEALTQIRPMEFQLIHHSELDGQILQEKPDLIYLTGRVTHDWTLDEILNDYAKELSMLREVDIPTIAVCAGHQLVSVAYGSDFGMMIETKEGEEPIREAGYIEMDILQPDPIFKGLGDSFTCFQVHRDEVKNVPKEFNLLASTVMCPIQAIKHKSKPMYSFQFHPERYSQRFPDGKIILENILSEIK